MSKLGPNESVVPPRSFTALVDSRWPPRKSSLPSQSNVLRQRKSRDFKNLHSYRDLGIPLRSEWEINCWNR